MRPQTAAQQELKYKRKRSRSDVRRVRQVVEHRADAGSQTASDRAHHKARKQAKRVAEVDTGNIATGTGIGKLR